MRADTEGNCGSPARTIFCIREHDRRTVHQCCRNRGERDTGDGARSVPHPPRRCRTRRDTRITMISRSGTQHRNHRISPRGRSEALGYKYTEDRGLTVRRSSAEPAGPFDPITTHAQSRTLGDNPTERTACPISLLSQGERRSTRRNRCPHR